MSIKTIGRSLIVVIVIIMAYLIYLGLFTSVRFSKKNIGPYYLVCEKYIGAYSNTGEVMDRIYNELKKDNVDAERGFGLYYDNPREVEESKLRSIVGCILERDYHNRLNELKKKYRIELFPQTQCITTSFPYKGTLSIFMGIIKVYPGLSEEIEKGGYKQVPVMEIYDSARGKIDYFAGVGLDEGYYNKLISK